MWQVSDLKYNKGCCEGSEVNIIVYSSIGRWKLKRHFKTRGQLYLHYYKQMQKEICDVITNAAYVNHGILLRKFVQNMH